MTEKNIVYTFKTVALYFISTFYFAPGYDSDVAREKNMDYTLKTYANSLRETSGVKPHEQEYESDDRYQYIYVFHPVFGMIYCLFIVDAWTFDGVDTLFGCC